MGILEEQIKHFIIRNFLYELHLYGVEYGRKSRKKQFKILHVIFKYYNCLQKYCLLYFPRSVFESMRNYSAMQKLLFFIFNPRHLAHNVPKWNTLYDLSFCITYYTISKIFSSHHWPKISEGPKFLQKSNKFSKFQVGCHYNNYKYVQQIKR